MPLRLGDRTAVLDGVITVEDAEPLTQWLRATPAAEVDLRDCAHLHTAAVQALLVARATVTVLPEDPFLRQWVVPAFAARTSPDPDPEPDPQPDPDPEDPPGAAAAPRPQDQEGPS